VELRRALESVPDLAIVWVMADNQINPRTRVFIEENGLRERVHFWADPGSRAIRQLGILKPDPEAIEAGVPHPATYLLDANGVIRFVDVRKDFHIWLDPVVLTREIAALRRPPGRNE
jgi:peroxiredoxin